VPAAAAQPALDLSQLTKFIGSSPKLGVVSIVGLVVLGVVSIVGLSEKP
jgi:hypothetical protein